jgi:hypothetical protein
LSSPRGGTDHQKELEKIVITQDDKSLQNMAQAILEIQRFFKDPEKGTTPEALLQFLLNKVLLIYVATQNLDDAFRLFTILNDRGVPLRNSDILKSLNLGALEKDSDKTKYAKLWEEAESELGDDFDRFLNYLRTILVKDKARLNLLQEFEQKIYDPKEREKSSGQKKPALLKKGKDTFQLVERYLNHYITLLGGNNYDDTGSSFQFDNLVKVMLTGLPSTEWIPPLLRYFDRFNHVRLLDFLILLDNKFSADWIEQYAPTDRIENMNQVIKAVEQANTPEDVLAGTCFKIDADGFMRTVDATVYGRRFTRYLLLKLDFLYQDHAHRMTFETLSVEHILPQTPADGSQWKRDFSDDYRDQWTDRLGNLVLISTKKNSSQGRLDYTDKKARYFSKNISTCPNSLRVLQNLQWTPVELEANHVEVLKRIRDHHGLNGKGSAS